MDVLSNVLSSLGFDFSSFIFNIINFSLLGFIIYKLAYKKISTVLEERQKIINDGIEKSVKAEELIKSAQIDSENIILNAKNQAANIVENAKLKASSIIEEAKQQAIENSNLILQKAQKEAEIEKIEYLNKFKSEFTELVIKTAEKLIEDEFSSTKKSKNVKDIESVYTRMLNH